VAKKLHFPETVSCQLANATSFRVSRTIHGVPANIEHGSQGQRQGAPLQMTQRQGKGYPDVTVEVRLVRRTRRRILMHVGTFFTDRITVCASAARHSRVRLHALVSGPLLLNSLPETERRLKIQFILTLRVRYGSQQSLHFLHLPSGSIRLDQ